MGILLSVVVLFALIYCLAFGLSLRPSELQIVNHYTAFGTTNFYRNKWYYLLSFIGFSLIVMVMNVALTAKMYQEKGRGFALAFAWMSLALLIIAAVLSHDLLQVALLS